ncbi:MAG: hypothetical protein QXO71_06865 [Candidatus Jordarchaeaceae archaeon]
MGSLVEAIRVLRGCRGNHCSGLNDAICDLLDKHTEIRNSLIHPIKFTANEISNLINEIKSLLYGLRVCTPTIFLILQKRHLGYRTQILWGHFPRQVVLVTQVPLKENAIYYSSPFITLDDTRQIDNPPVIISSGEMFRQYQKFQKEKGLEIQISESEEIISVQNISDKSAPSQVSIIGLRSWSKLIFGKILEAVTKGDNFTRENFEKLFSKIMEKMI